MPDHVCNNPGAANLGQLWTCPDCKRSFTAIEERPGGHLLWWKPDDETAHEARVRRLHGHNLPAPDGHWH